MITQFELPLESQRSLLVPYLEYCYWKC
uniref:Uncharacterized protein n=1 Tax=Arundo donax TaxID=35708 RepID=A0A0A9G5K3_ARUDO